MSQKEKQSNSRESLSERIAASPLPDLVPRRGARLHRPRAITQGPPGTAGRGLLFTQQAWSPRARQTAQTAHVAVGPAGVTIYDAASSAAAGIGVCSGVRGSAWR